MHFLYEAKDASGQTVTGRIDGGTEADACRKLLQSGYRVQAIAPIHPVPGTALTGSPRTGGLQPVHSAQQSGSQISGLDGGTRAGGITLSGAAARAAAGARSARATGAQAPDASRIAGVTTRDQLLFFQQLTALVRSGMSVYASLDNLAARTPNANLARTAREMAEQAQSGGKISEVMARYPGIYPEHVLGLVQAGETGGFLEIALAEAADNYERNIALYRSVWIPRLMATQALFMFAIAQPLFPTLFPDARFALYAKIVLLRNLPITLGLYLLIRAGARRLQAPGNRQRRDAWSLRLPSFGELQRVTTLASFLRTLRRLYAAGIAPIHAWEGAMYTANNTVLRQSLTSAYGLLQRGASLPEAFAATHLFAGPIEQLIMTGHQSGQVVEMLDQAEAYYRGKVEEATGKARLQMLRLGVLAMLLLGGGTMLWMTKTYFKSIFDFAESFSAE